MATYFFDSSALVKRYVKETGTTWVTNLIDPVARHEIYIARIAGVEVVSAIKRRESGGTLSLSDAVVALSNFHADFGSLFAIVDVGARLISETRAAVAKRRSSARLFAPSARISSKVRASHFITHFLVARSALAVSARFSSNTAS